MTSANLLKFVLTLCICSSVFGQDLPEWVERAEAGDANAQAAYLTHFRADAIVADAEAIYSYEGSNEINAMIVGRAVTGYSAFV